MPLPFFITIHNRRAPVQQPFQPAVGQAVPAHYLSASDLVYLVQNALTETFSGLPESETGTPPDPAAADADHSAPPVRLLLPSKISLSGQASKAPRFVQVRALLDAPPAVLLTAAERAAGPDYESEFSKYDETADADVDVDNQTAQSTSDQPSLSANSASPHRDSRFDYGLDSRGSKITFARIRNALVALRQAPAFRHLETLDIPDRRTATTSATGHGIEVNFVPISRTHRVPTPTDGSGSAVPTLIARPVVPDLAVFDMDSTLIDQEVIDELAKTLGEPFASAVEAITDRAMRGELDFEASLRARVKLLKGIPAGSGDHHGGGVFDKVKPNISIAAGVRQLFRVLHSGVRPVLAVGGGGGSGPGTKKPAALFLNSAHKPATDRAPGPAARRRGAETALLSGGFVPIAKWIARKEELDIDHVRANVLAETTVPASECGAGDNGGGAGGGDENNNVSVLSGGLVGDIVGPVYKRSVLRMLERRNAAAASAPAPAPAPAPAVPGSKAAERSASSTAGTPAPGSPDSGDGQAHHPRCFVLAVGDGANDLYMLRAADAGVAYRAKAVVERVAPMRLNLPVELVEREARREEARREGGARREEGAKREEVVDENERERDLDDPEPAGMVDVLYLLGWDRDAIVAALRG